MGVTITAATILVKIKKISSSEKNEKIEENLRSTDSNELRSEMHYMHDGNISKFRIPSIT